jgi:hypothetical protein
MAALLGVTQSRRSLLCGVVRGSVLIQIKDEVAHPVSGQAIVFTLTGLPPYLTSG